ncbi:MAG: hypothetical protein JRH05_08680 [Deltaproteobacteria bacterium]|nr:hypothetical protein [Deltaproteobacteria bacterium]
MNAVLRGAEYVHEEPVLSWRHEGHKVSFWRDRIAADDLGSRQEAEQEIEYLVRLVNETWERRDEITPDERRHPRTNCKECGESNCFNFALKLASGDRTLEQCPSLHTDPGLQTQKDQLEDILHSQRPAPPAPPGDS